MLCTSINPEEVFGEDRTTRPSRLCGLPSVLECLVSSYLSAMELLQMVAFVNRHFYAALHDIIWREFRLKLCVSTLTEMIQIVTEWRIRVLDKLILSSAPTLLDINRIHSQAKFRSILEKIEIETLVITGTNDKAILVALCQLFRNIKSLTLNGCSYPEEILMARNLSAAYISGMRVWSNPKREIQSRSIISSASMIHMSQLPDTLESIRASATLFSFDEEKERNFSHLTSIVSECLDPRLLKQCFNSLQSLEFQRFRFDASPILQNISFPALTSLSFSPSNKDLLDELLAPNLSSLSIFMPREKTFNYLRNMHLTNLDLQSVFPWRWMTDALKEGSRDFGQSLQHLSIAFVPQRGLIVPDLGWLAFMENLQSLKLHSLWLAEDLSPFLHLKSLRKLQLETHNTTSWLRFAAAHKLTFETLTLIHLSPGIPMCIDSLPACQRLLLVGDIHTESKIDFVDKPPLSCILQGPNVNDAFFQNLVSTDVIVLGNCRLRGKAGIDKWQFASLTLCTRDPEWLAMKSSVNFPVFIRNRDTDIKEFDPVRSKQLGILKMLED